MRCDVNQGVIRDKDVPAACTVLVELHVTDKYSMIRRQISRLVPLLTFSMFPCTWLTTPEKSELDSPRAVNACIQCQRLGRVLFLIVVQYPPPSPDAFCLLIHLPLTTLLRDSPD